MKTPAAKFQLVTLPHKFFGAPPPAVTVVDLRGQRGIISPTLFEKISETLARGEQAIIFLNRRGSASSLICRDCGQVARCPHCELPFTLHGFGRDARLICHHCGRIAVPELRCSSCGSVNIKPVGTGTQSLEKELRESFPEATIARADRDTTQRKEAHDRLFSQMQNGEIDILIGTQMIAKGLDLPNVALVGIVLADVGLHRPDWRAPENIFQLITQVAGRAGRRDRQGEVVIQTYSPDHYAIQFGARQDFTGFFEKEITAREEAHLPPFSQPVQLELRHPDKSKSYQLAFEMGEFLRAQADSGVEILGPAPTLPPKIAQKYRWQILLFGQNADLQKLLKTAESRLQSWRIQID